MGNCLFDKIKISFLFSVCCENKEAYQLRVKHAANLHIWFRIRKMHLFSYRSLIDFFSGIATGSIYRGTKEMRSTFIGECQGNNTGAIVIKTHRVLKQTSKKFEKAVLIIRNPFDALLSEFNRQNSGKTLVAQKEIFLSKRKSKQSRSAISKNWYNKNHILPSEHE